jgi:hypothetical protein
MTMRKLILTIGVAALAVAFQGVSAAAPGYEETEFDRTLPNIPERMAPKRVFGSPYEELELERALPQMPERGPGAPQARGAPYEETLFDRTFPSVPGRDMGASVGATMTEDSVWDRDHHFVAPTP